MALAAGSGPPMVVNKLIQQPGSPFLDSFKEAKALPNDDLQGMMKVGGWIFACISFPVLERGF